MAMAVDRMYTILYLDGYDMNPKIMVATAVFGLCCNIINLIALGDCDVFRGEQADEEDFGHNANENLSDNLNDSLAASVDPYEGNANKNLNIRSAMIHMVGDLIQSIGVIIAGLVIMYFPSFKILDPILTFIFSIIVFTTTI